MNYSKEKYFDDEHYEDDHYDDDKFEKKKITNIENEMNSDNKEIEDSLDLFMNEINKVLEKENKEDLKEKQNNFNNFDNTLDDNDHTADIYEFIENKIEIEEINKKKELNKKNFSDIKNENKKKNENENENEDENENENEKKNDINNNIIIDDINYNEILLKNFEKNIFMIDKNSLEYTLEESVNFKKQNNIITNGFNIPKPIFSLLQVKGLIDECILKNIYDHSFNNLKPIQTIVIPVFLSGRDLIAISKKGSGKKISFIISLIIHLLNLKKNNEHENNEFKEIYPHAIILTVTKEKIFQCYEELNKLSLNKLKCFTILNEINHKKMYDKMKGADVIISNVNNLINFVNKKIISLKNIKYVILNEFDKLFEKEYYNQTASILKNIRTDSLKCFFSSIISEHVINLVKPFLNKKYVQIKIGDQNDLLKQKFYILNESNKYITLLNYLSEINNNVKGIIFCNNKKSLMSLHTKITNEKNLKNLSFDFIHTNIKHEERINKYKNFKNTNSQILITTGLISRNSDITNIEFIINYDSPNNIINYKNRISSCSKFDHKEIITFLLPSNIKIAHDIYNHLKENNENIDENLKDFVSKTNIEYDKEVMRLKRKSNKVNNIFSNECGKINKKQKNNKNKKKNKDNKDNLSEKVEFTKITFEEKQDILDDVNIINPNDVLSSSDESDD